MTTAAWCTNPLLQHQLHPPQGCGTAHPTNRGNASHQASSIVRGGSPPRGIWSDPAPEPEPTPGANATRAALPQPYFADERMLDMVHSLQLHQGLAMLTASTANPDQGIARALLLNSLNETLEFLDPR